MPLNQGSGQQAAPGTQPQTPLILPQSTAQQTQPRGPSLPPPASAARQNQAQSQAQAQGQGGPRVAPAPAGGPRPDTPIPLNQATSVTGFQGQAGAVPAPQVDMSNLAVLPDGRIVPIDQIPPREELAFQSAVSQLLPLSPEQIRELRELIDRTDRAVADPLRPERPSVSSLPISLAPGGPPPEVRTGSGRVTALSFYDVTGAPYPVSAVVVGNPDQFQVEAPIPEGNLVTISPLSEYAEGNMAITLLNQPVPIVVKLIAGREVVDYRIDMQIAARGPLAAPALQFVDNAPAVGDPVLSAFIDGLPPNGARPLQADQPGIAVWRFNNNLYLRTRFNLLSPAWLNSAAGAGGVRVYVVPDVPVILASDDGRLVQVAIADPDQ